MQSEKRQRQEKPIKKNYPHDYTYSPFPLHINCRCLIAVLDFNIINAIWDSSSGNDKLREDLND